MSNVKKGFTLVELLVVIGIISLLISILLPSLSRARESAQSVVCLSGLRQIGIGVHMYANDNKGIVVPFKIMRQQNGPGNWNEWGAYYTWFHLLYSAGYVSANGKTAITQVEADTTLTAFQTGVLRCPSDANLNRGTFFGFNRPRDSYDTAGAAFWRVWDPRGADFIETSYCMNSQGMGIRVGDASLERAWYFPGLSFTERDDAAYKNKVHKLSTVGNASRLMFIFDGVGSITRQPEWLNARHMGATRTNVLFLDGHAESFATKELPRTWDHYWSAQKASEQVSSVEVFVNQNRIDW